jgi:hypothetical protein
MGGQGMTFGIDWKQPSTIRGLIWILGGLIATGLVIAGDRDGALTMMTVTPTVAGAFGMVAKD